LAGVTFSFNLEPVVSASARGAASVQTDEATAATAAKYQAVEADLHSNSTAVEGSPACDGSGCYIVHGDGPGVTTLSIGEEDGGSDYLSVPVVDGSEFLVPPSNSISSGPSYEVTTLAIGEEDGGVASAGSAIGTSPTPIASPIQSEFQFALEDTPLPRLSAASATAEAHVAHSPLPPVQTVPIIEPTAKPTRVASVESPVPEIKPLVPGTQIAATPNTSYQSVGDYESYLTGMAKGDSGTSVATSSVSGVEPSTSAAGLNPTAIYVPPPLAPLELFEFAAPEPYVAITYAPPPLAPLERVEVVLQPIATTPIASAGLDSVVAPRMKPASFTTSGPATLGPIETVPIQSTTAIPSDLTSSSIINGPIPIEKPESASLDAPRLTEDDFKITTLALGEEESGGG